MLTDGSTGWLVRGGVAGAVAWWAMDQTLTCIYDRQSAAVRHRESRARGGVPALEVLAARLAAVSGRPLRPHERAVGGTMLQWGMGVGAGVVYAAKRQHLPGRGVRRGLLYGAAFSLIVDEGVTPLLGLASGPRPFPWQTHARGLVGHLVYGAVAEVLLEALEAPDGG